MSFNSVTKKPKLVEGKLVKYYNEKYKQKELKLKIEQDELLRQKQEMELNNIIPEPWHKKLLTQMWEFIKENYGFFIIFSLIIILLWVRYIEVTNRKNKMKKVIDAINKKQELEQIKKQQYEYEDDEEYYE